ncbi:MAG: cytochrome c [Bacteroidales bacterium]|nr:cytochrome c [Bacteroidales bacterium]MCF8349544.1 cytochrome c [Bacteroidales bacterium]MCF8375103.1 cytochrome c [Bacteroidales bacterium]MCF8400010.1 cytochrome c [Bacteroidales bacterium]
MKIKIKTIAPILIMAILSVSVAVLAEKRQQKKTKQAFLTELPQEAAFTRGKEIYMEKCVVCHQENGKGITGAFPPLANSDYLLADKKRAVEQVLNGSNEEMIVNGVTYRTPMPPQVDNKQDAVAVVNYILNTWGNDGGTVSMEEVEDIKIKR